MNLKIIQVLIIRLRITPLGKVPQEILEKISEGLKPTFRMVVKINPPLNLPNYAFKRFRNQYQANLLLDFLEKNRKGRTLGITSEDAYAQGLNFVFGQAKLNGKVAVVSLCRLDPKFYSQPEDEDLFVERAVKEAIHEVGHTLGLGHCNRKGCVMTFSNTIIDVDRKTKNLCQSCKLQLGFK